MAKKSREEIHKELQAEYDKANYLFDSRDLTTNLKVFRKLYEKAQKHDNILQQASSLYIIGYIHHYLSENTVALDIGSQALILFKKENYTKGICDALNLMSAAYIHLGLLQKALEINQTMIETAATEADLLDYVAIANNNLGNIYADMGLIDKAIKFYKASLYFHRKINDVNGTLFNLMNIATIYGQNKKHNKAVRYYKQCLTIVNKHNLLEEYSSILCSIGTVYLDSKELKKAKYYFRKALNYSDKALNIIDKVGLLINLSKVYIAEKDFDEARNLLTEVANTMDMEQDLATYKLYIDTNIALFVATEDYKSALEYKDKAMELHARTLNEENFKKIAAKEAEFEIKQKEKEKEIYRIKNEELAKANEELRILSESKDTIMRIVSHDLKNLIGTTSQVVQLLGFQPLNEKALKYVATIDTSTKRAIELVKDILETNEIEADQYSLELAPHKLDEYIDSMTGMFTLACEPKKINFITDFGCSDTIVSLNPDKMWQILNNLIHNAIKFTPKEGKVYLSTSLDPKKQYIEIKITDTGIGIPPEHIPILFDKFTKAKRKGTEGEQTSGVGLSIVKRLVQLHNGEISVSSEMGKGTEFCIKLPVILPTNKATNQE